MSQFVLDKIAVRAAHRAPDALLWTNTKGGFLMAPGHDSWFFSAVKKCQEADKVSRASRCTVCDMWLRGCLCRLERM